MQFRRKQTKTDIKTTAWFRKPNKTCSYDTYDCKIQVKIGWFWITIKKYWLDVITEVIYG